MLKEQDYIILSSFKNGALIVRSLSFLGEQSRRELDVTGLSKEEMNQEIIALYVLGAEEIKIFAKSIDQNQRAAIRETLHLLIGLEIIEESANTINVKNILSSQKFSFRQSMEKMFLMTQSMFNDARTSLLENNKKLAQDVLTRDVEVDKLYFLILRYGHTLLQGKVLEEELGLTIEQSHYYENIATQLERIADHAVKIVSVVRSGKIIVKKRFKKLFGDTSSNLLQMLDDAARLTNDNPERAGVRKLTNKIIGTKKDIDLLLKEAIESDFSETLIISDSVNRLQGYLINIAEALIDQSLAEK